MSVKFMKYNEKTRKWENIHEELLTELERENANNIKKMIEKNATQDKDGRHWNHGGGVNK